MTKINFNREAVDRLIAHTKAAPEHHALYGDKSTANPGLWIVGDQGIYLMSNGSPPLLVEEDKGGDKDKTKNFVVHANECNPDTMDFDRWWSAKQTIWGGDDGVEFLALADLERDFSTYPEMQKTYMLGVTTKGIGVYQFQKAPVKAA